MPRFRSLTALLSALVWLGAGTSVHAQCMLANPSFELAGSGGATFGGWNQFGVVGSSTAATHGAVAARVSGPNAGNWGVSAYWQRLDCAPGAQWSASVSVSHSVVKPLVGQCTAILNIEWRNASGDLISYESHTVTDASTPPGQANVVSVQSQAAPAGTAAVHFLLGVLQSPTDPQPDVFYDQATFDNLGPPTLDQKQWFDFNGGRTLAFGGRTWRVKGPGYYGPGPNLFCDTPSCTWVDGSGRLHLSIRNISGSWYSSEVALEQPLGYGDYIFTTIGRIDALDQTAVLGFFTWQYGACYDPAYGWWNPYNEIDVEWSRWGNLGNWPAQFVAQPYDYPGNTNRFPAGLSQNERTSHAFRWLSDRVEYRSWRGGPADETPGNLIHAWTYTGPHIPRPEQPRVHMNLWQFNGPPSANQEVIVENFTFVPSGVPSSVSLPDLPTRFSLATPNPFDHRATIAYTVKRDGPVELLVFDVSGRLVRTLVSGERVAGQHEVDWDGRDESGRRVASGVYLYRFHAGDVVETARVVLTH